jgi:hypothetical protein
MNDNLLPILSLSLVWWLSSLPLDPRFAGSNPSDDNGYLPAVKILSTTFFGREVKPLVSYRKIYDMLKNPAEYDRDTSPAKLTDISRQISLCFATRCVCWYFPRALVAEY